MKSQLCHDRKGLFAMNEGLKKFEELMRNDTAFQEKLKAAVENYTGEQTEQAVFEGVLVPLAKEYGITASFKEFQAYVNGISNEDRELSEDEVNQVAGGKNGGFGSSVCVGVGVGFGGGSGSEGAGGCVGVGGGMGHYECFGEGD